MKCKDINKDLVFFAEGSLTGKRKEEISNHLTECEMCRNFVKELIYNLEIIEKEKEVDPNPFMYSRIQNKINNIEQTGSVFITSAVKILRPVFISLLILSGIFSGFTLGNYYSNKYSYKASEYQVITYYLNDLQHESVETLLLSEELETKNLN